jgi:hypothetical protein
MHYNTYLAAVMVRDSTQTYPDSRKLLPIFTKILALAKSVIEYTSEDPGKNTFKVAMEIICPLYHVTRQCPHLSMRKEAILLLLSHPRREGMWDSILSGKVAEWMLKLEQDNYDGEYIEEHLRCRGMAITACDLVARRAYVNGSVPNRENTEVRYVEAEITW